MHLFIRSICENQQEIKKMEIYDYCSTFTYIHSDFVETSQMFSEQAGECVFFNFLLISKLLTQDRPKKTTEFWDTSEDGKIVPEKICYSNLTWLPFFGQLYLTCLANTPTQKHNLRQAATFCFERFWKLAGIVMYTKVFQDSYPEPRRRIPKSICVTQFHLKIHTTPVENCKFLDANEKIIAKVDLYDDNETTILVNICDKEVFKLTKSQKGYIYLVICLMDRGHDSSDDTGTLEEAIKHVKNLIYNVTTQILKLCTLKTK